MIAGLAISTIVKYVGFGAALSIGGWLIKGEWNEYLNSQTYKKELLICQQDKKTLTVASTQGCRETCEVILQTTKLAGQREACTQGNLKACGDMGGTFRDILRGKLK